MSDLLKCSISVDRPSDIILNSDFFLNLIQWSEFGNHLNML